MSISVNPAARVSAPSGNTPSAAGSANATAMHAGSDEPTVEIDKMTQLPVPPRFPWLSRMRSQLEPVAKQKPAFPSAPQLGDNVDQAA